MKKCLPAAILISSLALSANATASDYRQPQSGLPPRANVFIPAGSTLVGDGLTEGQVEDIVRDSLNQLRHCYEKLLLRNANSAGMLQITIVIGSSWRVVDVVIDKDTIDDEAMNNCVTDKIKRWAFPRTEREQVSATIDFEFEPLPS